MIPWRKQQIWFWFAAIMIVGGAACFLTDPGTVQVVHKNQEHDETEIQIARSKEKLIELSELQRLHVERDQAEAVDTSKRDDWQAAASEMSISQFHSRQESQETTSQIQQVTYPEEQISRASLLAPGATLLQTEIVQTSVTEERSQPKKKQLVWFSGSIQKITD